MGRGVTEGFALLAGLWFGIHLCDPKARLYLRADLILWTESAANLAENVVWIVCNARGRDDKANWVLREALKTVVAWLRERSARKAELSQWVRKVYA